WLAHTGGRGSGRLRGHPAGRLAEPGADHGSGTAVSHRLRGRRPAAEHVARRATRDTDDRRRTGPDRAGVLSMSLSQDHVKADARRSVEAHRDNLIGLARAIYAQPEAGFKEMRTSRLVAERLASLGVAVESGLALTGVKAILDSGRPGPTVAI